jgi:hypothetical protein
MPAPVRVKVWGLVWMTRRGYLIGQCVGLALVAVLIVLGLSLPRPDPSQPGLAFVGTFLDWVPAMALFILAVDSIEMFLVLRKFREAEARQAAEAVAPTPP